MSLSRVFLRAPARAHGQTRRATVATAASLPAAAPPTAVPGCFSAAAVISRGVRKTAGTTAAHCTAGTTCGTPAGAGSTAGGRGAPGRRAACGAAAADVSARLRDAWGGENRGKGATSLPAAATATIATCRRVVAVMGFPRAAFTAAAAAGIETWLLRPCRSAVAGSCYVSRAASTALLRRAEVAARQGGGLRNSSSVSDPSCSKFTHVAALPRQHPQHLLPTKQQQRLLPGQPQLPHLHGWGRLQVSLRRQAELLPFGHLSFLQRAGELRSSCLGGLPQAGPQQQRVHRQQVPQHRREQQRTSPGAQGRRSVRFVLPRGGQTQQQLILPPRNSLGSVRGRLFASSSSASQSPGRDSSGSSGAAGSSAAALTAEPFLTGTNAAYVEQMFAAWRRDPTSVHASWAAYFSNVQRGLSPAACFSLPPSSCTAGASTGAAAAGGAPARSAAGGTAAAGMWCPYVASAPGSLPAGSSFVSPDVVGEGTAASPQSVQDTSRLIQMVRGYQLRGHECAAVNPLELPRTLPFVSVPHSRSAAAAAKLDYTTYGFTAADLDRVFDYRVPGMEGFLSADRPPQTLGRLVQRLEEAYCGSIGVEYMHINDREVCNFIRKHIETPEKYAFPAAVQQKILARTARAQLFENFCGQRFSTSKRFGLDGCETMIVGLKALTKKAAREGVKSVVIGMPHRGRLNVLVNILHKPMQQLLSEFLGVTKYSLAEWGNSGDVKYHLGVEFDHFDADAQRYIHMGVLPNPSHLEAVDPLVIGQARAQQYYSGDRDCSAVLPVLLHGDASIAGQGVVYETLQMSQLPFYRVGGAIHIVVNNQIGFTTNPVDSCSGRYCTDVAKAFDAPIFHVNADDPEAVTFVSELAFKYRQHFKGDVFIDLIGYRRLGHNELDMPKFTQPAMYTVISQKKPVFDLYAEKLRQQGVVQEADLQKLKESISTFYNAEYEKCKTYLPTQNYEYSPQWKHLVRPDIAAAPRLTGVRVDRLRELGTRLYTLPPNFSVHPTVGKIFKERLHAVQANIDEKVIDFGTAETLCYATLLSDGFHVRVAGQDVQRGTFSHRHAVLHDQTTFEPYCIYHSLRGYNFPHEILFANSLLSEYAAMGYEFGYSLEHPDSLCVWEAQFGDFSNGAQIIIDQFVASGEVKWNKQSGIVLMLPHGYDGQGPEHSSGRIERLLQLCDDREDVIHKENWEIERSSVIQQHNLQVIMPSTPANMFHALRRQVHREFRKPLVIFSPKRMLKMRAAMCALRQLDEGTRFRRYIPDKTAVPEKVRRLIVCSGQVYYDIIAAREKRKASEGEAEGPGDQIAVARMEQLSPFPFDLFIKDLQQYPNLQTVVWAQEEPMNQGAWFYTSKRIENSLSQIGFPNGIRAPVYAGRDVNATTAVGDKRLHDQEVTQLLEDALDLGRVTHSYLEKYIHKQKEKEGQGNSQEGHAQATE